MSKLIGAKVSRFEHTRASKHVDPDGKYPHMSDLISEALKKFNDKLDRAVSK